MPIENEAHEAGGLGMDAGITRTKIPGGEGPASAATPIVTLPLLRARPRGQRRRVPVASSVAASARASRPCPSALTRRLPTMAPSA